MTKQEHPSALRTKKKGDFISHDEWNALVRFMRGTDLNVPGVIDDGGVVLQPTPVKGPYVEVYSHEDVPAYSVFGISLEATPETTFRPRARCTVRKFGSEFNAKGTGWLLLTNETVPLKANVNGIARVIGSGDTLLLKEGTGEPLAVGRPCGVSPGSYGLSSSYFGFTCLSPSDSARSVFHVAYAPDVSAFMGVVTEEITAYTDEEGSEALGSGKMKVRYRNPQGSSLLTPKSPWETEETDLIFDVYNLSKASFAVDEVIRATNVFGVGLVVDVMPSRIRPFTATGPIISQEAPVDWDDNTGGSGDVYDRYSEYSNLDSGHNGHAEFIDDKWEIIGVKQCAARTPES